MAEEVEEDEFAIVVALWHRKRQDRISRLLGDKSLASTKCLWMSLREILGVALKILEDETSHLLYDHPEAGLVTY